VPPTRTPGQRAGLTHADVLAAARELLAERGLESLTMRALAQCLGVAPNALYSHVAGKTALVDELLDDVLAGIQAPAPDLHDPADGLHQMMAATYEVLLSHPDLVPHFLARQGARGPHAHHLGEAMTAFLTRTGMPGVRAAEAVRVLVVYTIGSAAFAARTPLGADDDPPLSPGELLASFTSGLRWLLDGIVGPARPQP